eukprot:TRINITY_DN20783_c0_g1_i1.p1 TRINITY_DN20783_c0_g1~~TRINITY_DN20783_c0_g1_i1.p1  ORF type:complete len:536 (+),score=90.89 TRINITY_DN20783_c0_g1_i1:81-1610(+)
MARLQGCSADAPGGCLLLPLPDCSDDPPPATVRSLHLHSLHSTPRRKLLPSSPPASASAAARRRRRVPQRQALWNAIAACGRSAGAVPSRRGDVAGRALALRRKASTPHAWLATGPRPLSPTCSPKRLPVEEENKKIRSFAAQQWARLAYCDRLQRYHRVLRMDPPSPDAAQAPTAACSSGSEAAPTPRPTPVRTTPPPPQRRASRRRSSAASLPRASTAAPPLSPAAMAVEAAPPVESPLRSPRVFCPFRKGAAASARVLRPRRGRVSPPRRRHVPSVSVSEETSQQDPHARWAERQAERQAQCCALTRTLNSYLRRALSPPAPAPGGAETPPAAYSKPVRGSAQQQSAQQRRAAARGQRSAAAAEAGRLLDQWAAMGDPRGGWSLVAAARSLFDDEGGPSPLASAGGHGSPTGSQGPRSSGAPAQPQRRIRKVEDKLRAQIASAEATRAALRELSRSIQKSKERRRAGRPDIVRRNIRMLVRWSNQHEGRGPPGRARLPSGAVAQKV